MQPDKTGRTQSGYILVTTVLLLALITVLAFSAIRTSAIESQIAVNEQIHQRSFFLAEAGIEHAVSILFALFERENRARTRAGHLPTWDFALRGPDRLSGTANDAQGRGQQPGSFERGSRWLDVRFPDATGYTVTVWNNTEAAADGDFDTDLDGLVWIRSDAAGPRGGRSSIQVLLQGRAAGEPPDPYPAQADGGAAGSSSGRDQDPMADFDRQLDPGNID